MFKKNSLLGDFIFVNWTFKRIEKEIQKDWKCLEIQKAWKPLTNMNAKNRFQIIKENNNGQIVHEGPSHICIYEILHA